MKSQMLQSVRLVLGSFGLILCLILATSNWLWANSGQQSIFDVLAYQDVLEVELKLDLTEIKNNRRSKETFKGQFSFTDQNGQQQTWKAKVKQRGHFRRTRCAAMPPLKLNFKKKDLTAAGLAPFDDLKLVNHCIEEEKAAKDLLIKEYLAYKLYNELTDQSFRVQMIKINYLDSKTGETLQQWGFLIEDTAQMRARLGMKKTENSIGLDPELFDAFALKRMTLFQYMIGNTDWQLSSSRNLKIVHKEGRYFPIPYDFDFSALVYAPYATLNSEYNQTSFKERIFLGSEKDLEMLSDNLEEFRSKKDQLYQVVKDCDLLSRKSRRAVLAYLKSFYKNMDEIKMPGTILSESSPSQSQGSAREGR